MVNFSRVGDSIMIVTMILGETDCMDRSDEKNFQVNVDCFYSNDYFRCDESLCSPSDWSCGDGQCIPSWNRFGYQQMILFGDYCLSLRELNHMCEASHRWRLWTLPETGLCTNQTGYDDPYWSISQTSHSKFYQCIYLIRCALSRGFERDCICDHLNCSQIILKECGSDGVYPFPTRELVRSYMTSHYFTDHNWIDVTPDEYLFAGNILCRGYEATISGDDSKGLRIFSRWLEKPYISLDFEFCRKATVKNQYGPQFDPFCWSNQSRTFNGHPYSFDPVFCPESHRCLSYYRGRDRTYDCFDGNDEMPDIPDERYCAKIRKHRLSCSKQQPYCVATSNILYLHGICSDGYDRYVVGSDQALRDVYCRSREDPNCQMLREYIYNSSVRNISENAPTIPLRSGVPLHWYCDSFWDTPSHMDESIQFCQLWICPRNEYRCQTGQCIPIRWLCDGEWDCSDASDEEALLSIRQFSEHNRKLPDFNNRINQCHQKYSRQAFSNICNTSLELPCLQKNVYNPLNFTEFRPCLPFNRVGDGREDCIASHDEKNTIDDCSGSMLGFALRGSDGTCYQSKHRCSEHNDDPQQQWWCFYRKQNSSFCSKENDVICFDGSCQSNARCNGTFECLHGEDEYLCVPNSYEAQGGMYRFIKGSEKRIETYPIYWVMYPSSSMMEQMNQSTEMKHQRTIQEEENAFICNRGVAVGSTNRKKVCFCPPAYYGTNCQFYSDRITVITHLNITEPMSHSMFRIVAILHSNIDGLSISHHQFLANGTFEWKNPIKHKFTLLYSRLASFLIVQKNRYLDRDGILNFQPYSIHLNLFLLNTNETVELGQWIYPIYFDFLPSFRLVKILTVPDHLYRNQTNDPCQNQTCPSNSTCLPVFNQPGQFYCSCHKGLQGDRCQNPISFCFSYCSSESICKMSYRGIRNVIDQPFCVCPLGYYGPRCYIRHNECQSQPCLNNGTCHLTYDSTKEKPYRCECSSHFYGNRCEKMKASILINLNFVDRPKAVASVVQFCDAVRYTLEILVQDQQLIRGLPLMVSYHHPDIKAPIISILKTYKDLIDWNYWIVYLMLNATNMYIQSTPVQCRPVETLVNQIPFENDTAVPLVFKYHQICHHLNDLYCFYSHNYLCVCESNHYRAICFLHDINNDRCDLCFSSGKCLRGDVKNPKDFFCICPRCYRGDRCQFSMEAFGSTIDSLLSSYASIIPMIYVIVSGCMFLFGLINNIVSFLTFKRNIPRQTPVGHFFLNITLLNKLSLLCLFLKFVHHLIGSTGYVIPDRLNLILCKILSYLLSVSTRSFFWLASWITIDRLLIVVFPTKSLYKQAYLAKMISVLTILIISVMHWHEILYYTIIEQVPSTICVTNFEQTAIANYNRVTTFIHSLVPFSIQIISITLLIIHIARSRARVREKSVFSRSFLTRQMMSFKELYITPLAIIVSALPQVIISFTLACQELVSWQKHLLLCTFLLSYTPQIFAFFLFVLPSSVYKKEFERTWIGQNLFV